MELNPDSFKGVLSSNPKGVAVVTASSSDGKTLVGLTLTAFCSVSVDPPLILVCVDNASNTLPVIVESGGFTVNLIAEGRGELANLFATKSEEKFNGIAWIPNPHAFAGPILHEDISAHLACSLENSVEAGDHHVMIGRVVQAELDEDRAPLVYHRKAFKSLVPIAGTD